MTITVGSQVRINPADLDTRSKKWKNVIFEVKALEDRADEEWARLTPVGPSAPMLFACIWPVRMLEVV